MATIFLLCRGLTKTFELFEYLSRINVRGVYTSEKHSNYEKGLKKLLFYIILINYIFSNKN